MRGLALPPVLGVLTAALALAADTHTLDALVRLVRDAAGRQRSDAELARALHRFILDDRMDNRTAEELESLAPGPKSVAEIEGLREARSASRKPRTLPQFPSPPEPSPDEQRRVIETARAKALAYTAGLPDFICTQTVTRYEGSGRSWLPQDVLTLQLTFFEHAEKYKLTAVNGLKTERTYEQMRGALSRGEFGSMLLAVFAPASQTAFQWSNWTTLRHRPAYVFSARIDAANSRYSLTAAKYEDVLTSTVVGEHGLVYIDRQTGEVLRLDIEAEAIPRNFPLESATRTLDYGPADVGGRSFLLPLHAGVRMSFRDSSRKTRNEVGFSGYRKFTGESSISFGGVAGDGGAAGDPAGAKR